jgi:hypothetical protein
VNIWESDCWFFSSAAIGNWPVLASVLRVVEQIRWGQGSGSLGCLNVFCEIKDKKDFVKSLGVRLCRCEKSICEVERCLSVMFGDADALQKLRIRGHGSNCLLHREAWGSCSPSVWSQVHCVGPTQQPSSCSESGK